MEPEGQSKTCLLVENNGVLYILSTLSRDNIGSELLFKFHSPINPETLGNAIIESIKNYNNDPNTERETYESNLKRLAEFTGYKSPDDFRENSIIMGISLHDYLFGFYPMIIAKEKYLVGFSTKAYCKKEPKQVGILALRHLGLCKSTSGRKSLIGKDHIDSKKINELLYNLKSIGFLNYCSEEEKREAEQLICATGFFHLNETKRYFPGYFYYIRDYVGAPFIEKRIVPRHIEQINDILYLTNSKDWAYAVEKRYGSSVFLLSKKQFEMLTESDVIPAAEKPINVTNFDNYEDKKEQQSTQKDFPQGFLEKLTNYLFK